MIPAFGTFAVDLIRLSIWLVILAVIFVPLERLFAVHAHEGARSGRMADIGLYFLNSILPALIIGVPMAAIVATAHRIVPDGYYDWVGHWPLALRLSIAFLVGELGFYWGHRWTHEVPVLWRFHAMHHRPEHMDWLVNTHSHPVDMVFVRLCGLTPLYLLGLSQPDNVGGNAVALAVVLVGTVWGFFIHANIRWRLGPLEAVLATPFFHHWHHVRTGSINRNYAAMLPMLDRLFGTLHMPRAWPADYGVAPEAPATEAVRERTAEAVVAR